MLVRIVQFLIGAGLAGGGGYLVWTQRALAPTLFPPTAAGLPWLLVAGVAATLAGVVFVVSAITPRPKRAARLAAEAERRADTIRTADAFYSERARAADRDWRSGDLPPQPPQPSPHPTPQPAQQRAPAPPPPPSPGVAKPVAAAAPPPNPFPSTATLAPIPKAAEPPPASTPTHAPAPTPAQATAHAPSATVVPLVVPGAVSFPAIRQAIAENRLDEADRMLNAEREHAQGEALAELTGLAGDHAAAAGRQSNAKWLWRLALKRFGECNAMNSAAARAVSERLRLADN